MGGWRAEARPTWVGGGRATLQPQNFANPVPYATLPLLPKTIFKTGEGGRLTPEQQIQFMQLRTNNYFEIMRTTLFSLVGLSAVIAFAPSGAAPMLILLVLGVVVYGYLGSKAALDDVEALHQDMKEVTSGTQLGLERNYGLFKTLTVALLGLIALTMILAAVA